MKSAVGHLLTLVRDERDAVRPFFDSFAQLGDAYAELDRLAFGCEFQEASAAVVRRPDAPDLARKLDELVAARGRLLQMAMAFAAERKEGKWPELLRQDAHDALRRLDAAIDDLKASR